MNASAPKSLPMSESKINDLISGLTEAGFIETRATKNESGKVTFREFRDHAFLRNAQTSIKRRDPDMGSIPVVSIYIGNSPKVVANPAAKDTLSSIVANLTPDID